MTLFFSKDRKTVSEFLNGLNIIDTNDVETGKNASLKNKKRVENFTFVRFDRKKDYKKETFNPVITGLASRSPTYTFKDEFKENRSTGNKKS